jgi:nucleoid-associated protein YgaU
MNINEKKWQQGWQKKCGLLFFLLSLALSNGCSSGSDVENADAKTDDSAFSEKDSSDTDAVPNDSSEDPHSDAAEKADDSTSDEKSAETSDASPADSEEKKDTTDSSESPSDNPKDNASPDSSAENKDKTATDAASNSAVPPSDAKNDASTASANMNTASNPSGDGAGDGESYSVQSGDTLMHIAYENYGDLTKWRDIYEMNKDKISNPNQLPKGIALKLNKNLMNKASTPSGEKLLIKSGDTLGKISARLYGTSSRWKELWNHNKTLIKNPNKIYAGFYLFYENASAPAETASVAEQPAAAQPPVPAPMDAAPAGASSFPVPQFDAK